MSFQRDIAWQAYDRRQRSGVAYQYAEYALGLTYDMLPDDVVHQARRCLLDAVGCAIGGHDAPARAMCEDVVHQLGGTPEATVIGSGLRTNASNANLVNSLMVRFLDFNDLGGGGHNSDSIPSLLAVCEREKLGGRDFITSLVACYELGSRINVGVGAWGNWVHDARAALIVPPAIGRLLGLNADQIANAIGVAASGNCILGVLDMPGEERVMRKNLRFGWTASAAIVATLLARNGFTGPLRVFEGEGGMNEAMFKGEANLEVMTDFRGWKIHDTRFKYLCATVPVQGIVQATLELVRENDIKPEDIAKVRVSLFEGASGIRPTTPIRYPRNAETADHSAYYLTAIAIKDREMTADSVIPDKMTDPVILDLIERISVVADPTLSKPGKVKFITGDGFEGKSEITTKDGRVFQRHVVVPHGLWGGDTLTDDELVEKFKVLASRHLDDARIEQLLDVIWNVERLEDMGELMKLTVF